MRLIAEAFDEQCRRFAGTVCAGPFEILAVGYQATHNRATWFRPISLSYQKEPGTPAGVLSSGPRWFRHTSAIIGVCPAAHLTLLDVAALSARTRRGGAYLIGDLTVRSLTAFAQLGLGDGRLNQIGGSLGGGLTLTAPLPSRAQDAPGLAVAAARNGSHYERAQTSAGAPAGETTVELTYLPQFGSWLIVQPDVQ